MAQRHWQDDPTLASKILMESNENFDPGCLSGTFSGSPNGHTPTVATETGCLSSPLVMDPRLGVKERSKLTGWVSSTVICVRG